MTNTFDPIAEPGGPGTETAPPAGRRRLRRALLALIALLLVVAAVLWFAGGLRGTPDRPSSSLRADLVKALERLGNAPALHYTGTIHIEEQGKAALDLTVSHPADALGTLTMAGSPALDYLGTDGKSFLNGTAAAWQSVGMADKSAVIAEHPAMVSAIRFFTQDPAAALAPPALAKSLLPDHIPDDKITADQPVTVNGRSCTPVHVDDSTLCLGPRSPDGVRSIERIAFPGDSTVVDVARVPREELNRFYTDLPVKLTGLRDAVNPNVRANSQILRDYEGACSPTSCKFTARVTVTYLGAETAAAAVGPVQVNYHWEIDRDGAPAGVGPECSGAVLIRPGQSSNLSCTGTGGPVSGATSGGYHGRLITLDVALTDAEFGRLGQRAGENHQKVAALPDLPPL
ncbi:hypothetical protein [Kitasatospora sp. NPDC002040]|uniref:hypothetical protein n=1 Tax=Kitasatospora sp. NPDC002040 TaxID=3154661 RepID=UPI00331C0BB5